MKPRFGRRANCPALLPWIFGGMAPMSKAVCRGRESIGTMQTPGETESGSAGTQPGKG